MDKRPLEGITLHTFGVAVLAVGIWQAVVWVYSQPKEIDYSWSGIQWTRRDAGTESVKINFSGEQTKDVLFQGNISVSTSDEMLYLYDDCFVYLNELRGLYYICPRGISPDTIESDTYHYEEVYGVFIASEDWAEITLFMLSEEPIKKDGIIEEVFTAPANSLEEAVALADRIAEGTMYAHNFYID